VLRGRFYGRTHRPGQADVTVEVIEQGRCHEFPQRSCIPAKPNSEVERGIAVPDEKVLIGPPVVENVRDERLQHVEDDVVRIAPE
jgi:hypothetical protein